MYHRESPQESARRGALGPTLPVQSRSRVPGSSRWSKICPRVEPAKPVEHQVSSTPHPAPSNLGALSIDDPLPSGGLPSSESAPSVLEVWFVGCHSDVGGSAAPDTVRCSLADISLRWMVDQVNESGCGIKFDDAALGAAGIEDSVVASSNSPGEEGDKEHVITQGGNRRNPLKGDIEAPTHDELKKNIAWWLLEVLPTKFTWQEDDGTWKSKWRYVAVGFCHPVLDWYLLDSLESTWVEAGRSGTRVPFFMPPCEREWVTQASTTNPEPNGYRARNDILMGSLYGRQVAEPGQWGNSELDCSCLRATCTFRLIAVRSRNLRPLRSEPTRGSFHQRALWWPPVFQVPPVS